MLELRMLPAREGDALWLRWRHGCETRQLIIDMGTTGTGTLLREQLVGAGDFELLVVTHIDSDHIGGVLSCLVDDDPPALCFKDIWFNGRDHLTAKTLEEQGVEQGKRLMDWLKGQPWNVAFEGGPVVRGGAPRSIELPGLRIRVLGPTKQRLTDLARIWQTDPEIHDAFKPKLEKQGSGKLEVMGAKERFKPSLPDRPALRTHAAAVTGKDKSKPNGSSIVLLVEHEGRRVLLTGDAYADDIVEYLTSLGEPLPIVLEAVKLPHHGSLENITEKMVKAIDCPLYLVSTDGTQHKHPHSQAIACVLEHSKPGVTLGFNCESKYSTWWRDPEWQERFGYRVLYGDADGLTVRI